ncbi:MAG TPA: hypothetical protein VEC37_03805, partial [Bacillota bacterium]|nr:hypothetical protein [Bacillota bacterium]
IDDAHCMVNLAFDGTKLTKDVDNLQLAIAGSELLSEMPLNVDNVLKIIADAILGKHTLTFQPGRNGYEMKAAVNYQNDLLTLWNSDSLELGKGISGKKADIWLYYPDLLGNSAEQIPANAQIEHAELILMIDNITGDKNVPRQIKLYTITDPDNYGRPYYGTSHGIRTGLDFQYRDHRVGREVPWKAGAKNIADLFGGVEPLDSFEFIPQTFEDNNQTLIRLDVKAALQSWLAGADNQGLYLTIAGDGGNGEQLMFYGPTAGENGYRPYLWVVYDNSNADVTPPTGITGLNVVQGNREVELNWTNPLTDCYGVRVVRKIGAVPVAPDDGMIILDGMSDHYHDTGLENGKSYYYAVFAYDVYRNYSTKTWIKAIPGTLEAPVLHDPVPGAGL